MFCHIICFAVLYTDTNVLVDFQIPPLYLYHVDIWSKNIVVILTNNKTFFNDFICFRSKATLLIICSFKHGMRIPLTARNNLESVATILFSESVDLLK